MPTTDRTLPEWIEEEEVDYIVVKLRSVEALYRRFEEQEIVSVGKDLVVQKPGIRYEVQVQHERKKQ